MALRAGGVVLALLAAPAWAADTGFHNPILHDPQAIAAGGALYQEHCYICHGRQGGRGPDIFENTLTDSEFYATVMAGRSGARGEMPSWAGVLSKEQIFEIEAFVKSRPHL